MRTSTAIVAPPAPPVPTNPTPPATVDSFARIGATLAAAGVQPADVSAVIAEVQAIVATAAHQATEAIANTVTHAHANLAVALVNRINRLPGGLITAGRVSRDEVLREIYAVLPMPAAR